MAVEPKTILESLSQAYDGTPKPATATTVPAGLAVDFTYDGAETAPTVTRPTAHSTAATVG